MHDVVFGAAEEIEEKQRLRSLIELVSETLRVDRQPVVWQWRWCVVVSRFAIQPFGAQSLLSKSCHKGQVDLGRTADPAGDCEGMADSPVGEVAT